MADADVASMTKMFASLMPSKDTGSSNGYKQYLVSGHKFDMDSCYQPVKTVGSGAYGVVISAKDDRYGKKVAIKKCQNAFDDIIDGKRILREIKLLQHFHHPNIIRLLDMIPPRDASKYNDVYIVLEYMESDLHKIIYSKNQLSDGHYQYFTYQLLEGLRYMHSCGVIHRDLKPSNLLVNSDCQLKICDMGLARTLDNEMELTEYVVTRWYRAPEVMCSVQDYNEKIDVWAVGCILGEMIRRKPLFAGDNYIHQLNLIFGTCGTPSGDNELGWVSNEQALKYIKKQKPKPRVDFKKFFIGATSKAIDLLEKMLVFNPNTRISIEASMNHEWLKALHKPEEKRREGKPVDFSWESQCKTRSGLKNQFAVMNVEVRNEAKQKYADFSKEKQQQKEA